MNLRNRRGALAVVGGGALLLVAVMMARDDEPAAARVGAAARAPGRAPGSGGPLSDVKLERLQRTPATLEEPERNPFRFEARSAPTAARAAPASPAPLAAPPIPKVVPAAGPPPPPPIPLRFIGLVEAPGQVGRVAILSDGRGNVFYGREGDTIEGRYKMLKVGPDVAELSYVDGRGRQTIRLSGQ